MWPERCDISVRKSRPENPEREREKVFLCVGTHALLPLCYTAGMCIRVLLNALAVRGSGALHGLSGQWKRAVLPVAERVLSAEVCGEINPGISLSVYTARQVSSAL